MNMKSVSAAQEPGAAWRKYDFYVEHLSRFVHAKI
jgi:hypothetical protein